jgi:hypothetical protein
MNMVRVHGRVAVLAVLAVLVLAVVPAASAAPAHAGLSVSGYAFTTQAAAEAALTTGKYAGGRWVVKSPVIRSYNSGVVYANAGWVVPFIYHQPTTRQVNPQPKVSGIDYVWFQGLGMDNAPFWWR